MNGQEAANFIPVVAWDKLAETCGNNLTKGRRVLVEGRLQIRTYETASVEKRRGAEVVAGSVEFLDRSRADGQSSSDLWAGLVHDIGVDEM